MAWQAPVGRAASPWRKSRSRPLAAVPLLVPERRMWHVIPSPDSASLSAAPLNWSWLREWRWQYGQQGHLFLRQQKVGEECSEQGWMHWGKTQPLLGKVPQTVANMATEEERDLCSLSNSDTGQAQASWEVIGKQLCLSASCRSISMDRAETVTDTVDPLWH